MKMESRIIHLPKLFVLATFALFLFVVSCNKEEIFENEEFIVAQAVSVPSSSSTTIQAENYDKQSGVRTENTGDSGGGKNVGFIDTGDYMEYDLNVSASGSYKFEFRVASRRNNSKFDFFQGSTKLSNVNKTATGGWQNWTTTSKTVSLSSGNSTLKILATGSGWNINWIKITPVDVDSGSGGSGNCNLPWTDNGFTLSKGTENYRKTVDISCANEVTLSLDAEGAGPMESSDYMRIYYKVDGGSQKTIYTKNDSFSKRSFSEDNIRGNTLEIIVDAKNSETKEIHRLTNVRVSSDGSTGGGNPDPDPDPDPEPDTGGSGSAAAIIGGMNSRWKLNGFSGSLRIGNGSYGRDGSNGLDYEDRASVSDNNNWFFDTNGYAAFKCHVGNPTSSGSGNMRSELRELNGNGNEIEWDGTTNTNHRMRYKVQLRQLPSSGKLCFGQIHGQGSFDDVIRVQLEDSNANRGANNGAGSGTYDVKIKGFVTETLDRDNRNKTWARMQMDKEYDVEISMRNKKVTVKLNGSTIYTSKDVNSKDNYFKAGAYLQSAQSDKSPQLKRHQNNFGEVWIKNMVINH